MPSSTPRSSIASSMSVRVNSRTTKPPPGSVSRSPSCSSVMRAIRSGVRETPSSSTRRSSGTRSRGLKAPSSRSSRSPSVAFVVCEFAWLPRGTGVAAYSRDGCRSGCGVGASRRAVEERDDRLHDAAPEEEEDRDDEDAVQDLAQLEARRQPLVEDGEDGRTDHRAEQCAETTERHHHEDAHVHAIEAVRSRADEPRAVGEQAPVRPIIADPTVAAIDPVARDVHTRELGRHLVVAERAKRPAEVGELEQRGRRSENATRSPAKR